MMMQNKSIFKSVSNIVPSSKDVSLISILCSLLFSFKAKCKKSLSCSSTFLLVQSFAPTSYSKDRRVFIWTSSFRRTWQSTLFWRSSSRLNHVFKFLDWFKEGSFSRNGFNISSKQFHDQSIFSQSNFKTNGSFKYVSSRRSS